MEQYDKNVTVILEFRIAENFSTSVISLHRLCYKALRKHLTEEKILYSSDAAYRWIDDNKACWTYRQYTGWKHCVDQLVQTAVFSGHSGRFLRPVWAIFRGQLLGTQRSKFCSAR